MPEKNNCTISKPGKVMGLEREIFQKSELLFLCNIADKWKCYHAKSQHFFGWKGTHANIMSLDYRGLPSLDHV